MRAIGDTFGGGLWKRTVLVLTHGNLVQTPPGTNYDTFVTRRIRTLRKAVPAGFLMRPLLQAVINENSEACPTESKSGKRMLPDQSLWVNELMATMVDMALKVRSAQFFVCVVWAGGMCDSDIRRSDSFSPSVPPPQGKPYSYKPNMTRKPNNNFKWLIPLVAAGQVRWPRCVTLDESSILNQLRFFGGEHSTARSKSLSLRLCSTCCGRKFCSQSWRRIASTRGRSMIVFGRSRPRKGKGN